MRRHLLLLLVLGIVSLSAYAQDDMYFTPSKQKKQNTSQVRQSTVQTNPVGRDISVDEYNRRTLHSSYQIIGTDSLGNDIIEFQAGDGVYPELDTTVVDSKKNKYNFYDDEDDFAYSRRMGMYDGFYGWYDPFFYPYHGWGWGPYWGSPWHLGYYDWYYGYYPWYWDSYYWSWGYPYYYGWGYPYYYSGWYGWGYPYYYGGGYAYTPNTANHGWASRGNTTVSHGRGYSSAPNGRFGGTAVRRNGSSSSSVSARRSAYASSHGGTGTSGFGGSRSSSSTSSGTYSAPARSSSSGSYSGSVGSYSGGSRSSGGGGSFGGGGSRSGGGSAGGSRGGGGGFGGRR